MLMTWRNYERRAQRTDWIARQIFGDQSARQQLLGARAEPLRREAPPPPGGAARPTRAAGSGRLRTRRRPAGAQTATRGNEAVSCYLIAETATRAAAAASDAQEGNSPSFGRVATAARQGRCRRRRRRLR